MLNNAGSHTRLNRSSNRRPRSASRPAVQLDLHPPYRPNAASCSGQPAAPVFTGVSSDHCSHSPCLDTLPPFPMWPAFPASEYYGGSAPPTPFGRQRAYPPDRPGGTPDGTRTDGSHVHCCSGRRARRPALPLRHRRGYAADLHHDLPGPTHDTVPTVPRHRPPPGDGRRLRTAHQPKSTGFELVDDQEASRHRFLAYTFPSRSPGPARPVVPDRPDFVAAAPTLPGVPRVRLPPASPRRYDGQAIEGLSPPSETTAPRGAPPL